MARIYPIKKSLYCFPCRIFAATITGHSSSLFASPDGYGQTCSWKKLYTRVPDHEISTSHKTCYLKWRQLEVHLKNHVGIDDQLVQLQSFRGEKLRWRELLKRILDVILFIGERGLAFQGETEKIGDVHNGNFLGIIELLSNYDQTLCEHVMKVKESQKSEHRLQAHYLSHNSQNEFIGLCGEKLRETMAKEIESAKYYSLMVDATPDISHNEQNTLIFRYLTRNNDEYKIQERFYTFIDNFGKTGAEIAAMILSVLEKNNISLEECRGQGYDNASNMSGKYNGVQSHLKNKNPLCCTLLVVATL